jgi:hypothetical protein
VRRPGELLGLKKMFAGRPPLAADEDRERREVRELAVRVADRVELDHLDHARILLDGPLVDVRRRTARTR